MTAGGPFLPSRTQFPKVQQGAVSDQMLMLVSGCVEVAGLRAAVGEATSAAACAKKGASGRMQRPAELVPIPECGVKASEGFGKLRESSGKLLHFGKIPKSINNIG